MTRSIGIAGLAGVVLAGLALPTLGTSAAAAPTKPERSLVGTTTDASYASRTVTLINGDRVQVTGQSEVSLLPREDGSVPVYETRTIGKDTYIYPADTAGALASGLVDEELFNVTGLIRQGYDDASSNTIPLIAQYPGSVDVAKRAPDTPRGSTTGAKLASIDALALSARKQDAAKFWADLRHTPVKKLWLDRQVSASLADSTDQIGAPVAWAEGLDGTGTTVAILDSGIDALHPDLASRVEATMDFTGSSPAAADGHGHGTHVASTVAGTGAASGGVERGVAPGTRLLIGKVLTDSGFGSSSAIIAGIQWAVAQDPDVISMSLGSETATVNCDDPIAQATAALTASSDSLFVVAAGNIGPRPNTISSPACVPAVLTVGAVDGEDETADFSSRGPVAGTHVLKPEIAAPGVDILAAATGGRGIYAYRTMSGTSMAAPHVAGAAAILRQLHPGWSAAEVKAVLVSTSMSDLSGDVRETGAGRVDLAAALHPSVVGEPAIQVGTFAWPQTGPKTTVQVPYTNLSDLPVELDLTIEQVTGNDGSLVKSKIATLGQRSVKVLAGETVSVPLTFDPSAALSAGQYGDVTGRIIAKRAHSQDRIASTPFAAYVEPRTVTLNVKLIDRNGAPAKSISSVDVLNLDTNQLVRRSNQGAEMQTFTVRPGSFFISSFIGTLDSADPVSPLDSATYLARPQFEITGDTTLILDARDAHRVQVRTDQPSEARVSALTFTRAWDEVWRHAGSLIVGSTLEDTYADVPTVVSNGDFEFGHVSRRYAPAISRLRVVGNDLVLHPQAPNLSSVGLDGAGQTALVYAGSGTAAELAAANVAGKIVLVKVPQTFYATMVMNAAFAAGAKAVLLYRDAPGRWAPAIGFSPARLAIYTLPGDEGAALFDLLAAGPVTIDWAGTAISPYVYNLGFFQGGTITQPVTFYSKDKELGRTDATYVSMGMPWTNVDTMQVRRPIGSTFITSNYEPVPVPNTRTEFYSGDDTEWRHTVLSGLPFGEQAMDAFRTYTKKTARVERWYDGTIAPTASQTETGELQLAAERQGNQIGFAAGIWGDSFGHWVQASSFGDFGNLELFREGTSVGYSIFPSGAFDVPAEDASYELVQNVFKDEFATPQWKRSMWVTTKWRFRSHLDESVYSQGIPILFPRLDLPEDGLKTLPAADGLVIPIRVTGHAGYSPGAITSAAVSWSYDGGTTWIQGSTRPQDDGWVAIVNHAGASGKQVMLRIDITDAKGAGVNQTITRAYDVR